jgi:cellulose synthase/poly-beta-1,6-N-acetylglucosamine synthase-like glycosyltransferase
VTGSVFAVILAAVLFLFEFQNLLALNERRVLHLGWDETYDFTIVVPVYGKPSYLQNLDSLVRWKANVLLSLEITNPEMVAFADRMEGEGWAVNRVLLERPTVPQVVRSAVETVTTTYVIRVDADTELSRDLPRAIARLQRDGADVCSVKTRVAAPATAVEKIQALEYAMSMLARHFRPWMLSGACIIARADALRRIYSMHTMWYPGEDIETGRIAKAQGYRVRHLDYEVFTIAPNTWGALFRQRRTWWAGSFLHTVVNCDRAVLHAPVWLFYYVALVWCGVYLHWDYSVAGLVHFAELFPLLWILYVGVTLVANWRVRSRWMLVFPLYSFVQSSVMPIFGVLRYVQIAWRHRAVGRMRFNHLPAWAAVRCGQVCASNAPPEAPRVAVLVGPPAPIPTRRQTSGAATFVVLAGAVLAPRLLAARRGQRRGGMLASGLMTGAAVLVAWNTGRVVSQTV